MTVSPIELLVLDAQGVTFNAPLGDFLDDLALRTGRSAHAMRQLWQREWRIPAWTGTISDQELWQGLLDGKTVCDPLALFESRFRAGPVVERLSAWHEQVPIWLLSNHRTHWLMPRLERFGLKPFFDRILVSDQLGSIKPEAAAFAPLLDRTGDPGRILFVDDLERNVLAARAHGIRAMLAGPAEDWIGRIDDMLNTRCRDLSGADQRTHSATNRP